METTSYNLRASNIGLVRVNKLRRSSRRGKLNFPFGLQSLTKKRSNDFVKKGCFKRRHRNERLSRFFSTQLACIPGRSANSVKKRKRKREREKLDFVVVVVRKTQFVAAISRISGAKNAGTAESSAIVFRFVLV